jgi:hypothetical protein
MTWKSATLFDRNRIQRKTKKKHTHRGKINTFPFHSEFKKKKIFNNNLEIIIITITKLNIFQNYTYRLCFRWIAISFLNFILSTTKKYMRSSRFSKIFLYMSYNSKGNAPMFYWCVWTFLSAPYVSVVVYTRVFTCAQIFLFFILLVPFFKSLMWFSRKSNLKGHSHVIHIMHTFQSMCVDRPQIWYEISIWKCVLFSTHILPIVCITSVPFFFRMPINISSWKTLKYITDDWIYLTGGAIL